MTVAQWMTKSVLTIRPHDTLRHARELMTKHRVNQLPVVVDDKVVGLSQTETFATRIHRVCASCEGKTLMTSLTHTLSRK